MADWYYVREGNQVGPVSETDLDALVARGDITPVSLVWTTGLPDWMPMGAARSAAGAAAAAAGSGAVACSQCGGHFPSDEAILYQGLWVCAGCKPLFFQKLREGVRPAGMAEFASIPIRFAADILDNFIVFVPLIIIFIVFFAGAFAQMAAPEAGPAAPDRAFGMFMLAEVLMYVVLALYHIFFVGRYGATPGKMICRIKIVRGDGTAVTYFVATGRFFAELLSALLIYIGYLMAFFDDEKRALHDRLCNTLVVKR